MDKGIVVTALAALEPFALLLEVQVGQRLSYLGQGGRDLLRRQLQGGEQPRGGDEQPR